METIHPHWTDPGYTPRETVHPHWTDPRHLRRLRWYRPDRSEASPPALVVLHWLDTTAEDRDTTPEQLLAAGGLADPRGRLLAWSTGTLPALATMERVAEGNGLTLPPELVETISRAEIRNRRRTGYTTARVRWGFER